MDVEKSSRAPIAFRQSFNALFWTVLTLSLFVSLPVPEARLLSGTLLAAYFLKTIVGVINSDNRRDECWRIARQWGLALKVIVFIALTLAATFVLFWIALRP